MKYEVVFRDSSDEETIVAQKFNTAEEADRWASDCEFDYQDIAIDENGNDYWKTYYKFSNPEDKDVYENYFIQECK